jgi:hypothetical protein
MLGIARSRDVSQSIMERDNRYRKGIAKRNFCSALNRKVSDDGGRTSDINAAIIKNVVDRGS